MVWRLISLVAVGVAALALPADADPVTVQRIQDGTADVCWSPDYEWPVPCDDDE